MGTAPDTRQHPAMPEPARIVGRSIALLRRLGLTESQAAVTVYSVALQVRERLDITGHGDSYWVAGLIASARDRMLVPSPSITEQNGNDYGDGSSSRTGSQPGQ